MQALISAKELHALLDQKNVKLLDASISFQIPSESKKITDKWIPNTYRFDYDNDFCLPDTSLPHMMPTEAGFNVSATNGLESPAIQGDSPVVDNAHSVKSRW